MNWNRQTYSLLDWLGDLGGLFESLFYICAILIKPVTAFTLKSTVLTALFRYKENQNDSSERLPLAKKVQDEFQASQRIESMNYLHVRCLPCWKKPNAQQYLRNMRKA